MSIDAEVTALADDVQRNTDEVQLQLKLWKTQGARHRAAAIEALGRVKIAVLRANAAGLQAKLAAELARRGYAGGGNAS